MVVFYNKNNSITLCIRNLRYAVVAIFGLFAFISFSNLAFALSLPGDIFSSTDELDISAIAESIIDSVSSMPGLLTAISYMAAILFGVQGILKLKDHVENPAQTPLRIALSHFAIGGALLSSPIVYEAAKEAFDSGETITFVSGSFDLSNYYSGLSGMLSGVTGGIANEDFNYLLSSIINSIRDVPGLVTGISYLLGILFGTIGLFNIKNHIENPEQNPLKNGIIRILTAGALFALPTLWEAMQTTIRGDDDINIANSLDFMSDLSDITGSADVCNPFAGVTSLLNGIGLGGLAGGGDTLGVALCSLVAHTAAFQAFLTGISYLFGIILGVWAVLKIQDHVLNPQQTSIWEGVSRFIAAGAFFSLPFMAAVFENTVAPTSVMGFGDQLMGIVSGFSSIIGTIGGFLGLMGGEEANSCSGLDGAINCFITDIFVPLSIVIKVFAIFAGLILIMIGISRMIKGSQDGARAPGGLGTMMTFITGGALLSYNSILSAFSVSFFNNSDTSLTYGAILQYKTGMSDSEMAHVTIVFSAILKFMVLIGLISFVRGLFIVRNVAEGDNQASLMAGITHMVGGALAVNLGPLMNAVQLTLGIAEYGIKFT